MALHERISGLYPPSVYSQHESRMTGLQETVEGQCQMSFHCVGQIKKMLDRESWRYDSVELFPYNECSLIVFFQQGKKKCRFIAGFFQKSPVIVSLSGEIIQIPAEGRNFITFFSTQHGKAPALGQRGGFEPKAESSQIISGAGAERVDPSRMASKSSFFVMP